MNAQVPSLTADCGGVFFYCRRSAEKKLKPATASIKTKKTKKNTDDDRDTKITGITLQYQKKKALERHHQPFQARFATPLKRLFTFGPGSRSCSYLSCEAGFALRQFQCKRVFFNASWFSYTFCAKTRAEISQLPNSSVGCSILLYYQLLVMFRGFAVFCAKNSSRLLLNPKFSTRSRTLYCAGIPRFFTGFYCGRKSIPGMCLIHPITGIIMFFMIPRFSSVQ